MPLPKLDIPKYKHKLIGSNKEIHYRPFTVKEQKIVLQAKEAKDQQQILEAIKQIVELCTFGEVNANDLPIFDIEDLFLKIRAKSVSEVSEINYKVKDSEEKVNIKINLNDVKIEVQPNHSNKLMISNDIGLKMKYPSLNMLGEDLTEFDIIRKCIDYVFDKESVYRFDECTNDEVNDFLDGLDNNILLKIKEFFDTSPRLRYETQIKLKDGSTKTIKFEGISDFFQ